MEAMVSIVFGIVVFDEVARSTATELVGQGAGLALVIAGVIKLASTQDDEEGRRAVPTPTTRDLSESAESAGSAGSP